MGGRWDQATEERSLLVSEEMPHQHFSTFFFFFFFFFPALNDINDFFTT